MKVIIQKMISIFYGNAQLNYSKTDQILKLN